MTAIDTIVATLARDYPTATPPQGAPGEAAQLTDQAIASDDPYTQIKHLDRAMELDGPTPDRYLIRSVAFNATNQQMWWMCDVRAAAKLLAEPNATTRFPETIWKKAFDRVHEFEATRSPLELDDYQRRWDNDQLYSRGFRALQRGDTTTALHYFGRALATQPSALTLWYAAFAALTETATYPLASQMLHALPTIEEGRANLTSRIQLAHILDVRDAVEDAIAKRASPQTVNALVKRALGAKVDEHEIAEYLDAKAEQKARANIKPSNLVARPPKI